MVFFLNVRAFKADRTSKMLREVQGVEGGPHKASRMLLTRDKPHNLVKCSLCKHLFSRSEAKRILTMSMI